MMRGIDERRAAGSTAWYRQFRAWLSLVLLVFGLAICLITVVGMYSSLGWYTEKARVLREVGMIKEFVEAGITPYLDPDSVYDYYDREVFSDSVVSIEVRSGMLLVDRIAYNPKSSEQSKSKIWVNLKVMVIQSSRRSHLTQHRAGINGFLLGGMFLGISGFLIVGRMLRQRRRQMKSRCLICGYDLTGNVSGRCSECGSSC